MSGSKLSACLNRLARIAEADPSVTSGRGSKNLDLFLLSHHIFLRGDGVRTIIISRPPLARQRNTIDGAR